MLEIDATRGKTFARAWSWAIGDARRKEPVLMW
jgi:hypothetical protein